MGFCQECSKNIQCVKCFAGDKIIHDMVKSLESTISLRLPETYFDKPPGKRNAHNKQIYPINKNANLNRSANIQVSTIFFISSGELPAPALAMMASLIGNTTDIDRITPNAIVRTVINKRFLGCLLFHPNNMAVIIGTILMTIHCGP